MSIIIKRAFLPVAVGGVLGSLVVGLSAKAVAVTIGFFVFLAMLAWPEVAFYSVIATTPVQLDFGGGVTIARVVVPIALLVIAVHALGRRNCLQSPLVWPAGLLGVWFFGVTAISVLFAANVSEAAKELLSVPIYGALFFLTLAFVRTFDQMHRLVWFLVVLGLIEAVITIAQVLTGFVLPGEWRHSAIGQIDLATEGFRAEGTAVHPITLAGFLQVIIPLALYMACTEKERITRVALLCGVPVLLVAWLSTYARSSFLGALAMAVTALMLFSKAGRVVGVFAIALTISAVIISSSSPGWITSQIDDIDLAQRLFAYADLNSTSTAVQFRYESWVGGWGLFLENWLFGVGYGQAVREYMPYLPGWATSASHPQVIHNAFIEIASETGLIGFLPFVGLWLWSFAVLWRLRDDSQLGAIAKTLIVILVGQLVFLMVTPMVREIWITLGMAICTGLIGDSMNHNRPSLGLQDSHLTAPEFQPKTTSA